MGGNLSIFMKMLCRRVATVMLLCTIFVSNSSTAQASEIRTAKKLHSVKLACGEGIVSNKKVSKLAPKTKMLSKPVTAKEVAYDWSKFASNYYYNNMTTEEKAIYCGLDSVCSNLLSTTTDVNYDVEYDTCYPDTAVVVNDMTEKDVFNVFTAFKVSNPQYYFLNGSCLFGEYDGMNILYPLVYSDFQNGKNRLKTSKNIYKKLEAIVDKAKTRKTDATKLKYCHDYIIKTVDYDDAMAENVADDSSNSQSIYDALLNGTGICAGYTGELTALCNALGIENVPVVSDVHAWNLVRLNGVWYNIDCTFDDNLTESKICYEFYCKSAKYLEEYDSKSKEHAVINDFKKFNVPECTTDSKSLLYSYKAPVKPKRIATIPGILISKSDSSDAYKISFSAAKDVTILYTINSDAPNLNAVRETEVYNEPFLLAPGSTLKVKAISANKLDSSIEEFSL